MNKKKILAVVLAVAASSAVSAQTRQAKVIEERELTPARESTREIPNARLRIYDDGTIEVSGREYVSEGVDSAYHFSVDVKTFEYTATDFTEEELANLNRLNSIKREMKRSALAKSPYAVEKEEEALGLLSVVQVGFEIQVVSEDPVQLELARTTGTVEWAWDSMSPGYVTATDTSADYDAVNPTLFFTEWFVRPNTQYGGLDYPKFLPVPENRATLGSSYYNYDYLDDDLVTIVSHHMEFTFYPPMVSPPNNVGFWDWTHTASGEHSWAIHGDISTDFYPL